MEFFYPVNRFCRYATFFSNADTRQQHDRLIQCPHQSSPFLSYAKVQQKQIIPNDTSFENIKME